MPMYDVDSPPTGRSLFADRPQLPYLIPFLVFVGIMAPGGLGHAFGIDWEQLWFHYTPVVYTVKTVAAAALLWLFWPYYTRIRWNFLWLGVIVGLIGLVQWVGMEYAVQGLWHHLAGTTGMYPRIFGGGGAKIYDPTVEIHNPTLRYFFYVIRIAGPALVVPVMEELFWRDFLMRALIRGARFQDVPIGTFTWLSLIGMAILFAAGHYQWPSGFVYGLMMGLLLIYTRSLGACIVAHGVTNLALGLYVLHTGQWQFW